MFSLCLFWKRTKQWNQYKKKQDREYTIPFLPAELQGVRLTCVQTAQGDKRAGGSRLWRLSLVQVRLSCGFIALLCFACWLLLYCSGRFVPRRRRLYLLYPSCHHQEHRCRALALGGALPPPPPRLCSVFRPYLPRRRTVSKQRACADLLFFVFFVFLFLLLY